jgi:CubicO group peptidase (beta-lactamase class C family)
VKDVHLSRALALSILFAAAPAVSAAETAAAMELESRLRAAAAWMDQRMTSSVAPGATAALVYDQSVLWSHAWGYADLDTARPATPETTFSICSISKLFTSIAVMDLVESGQVALDATLDSYLDGFDPVTADGVVDEPLTIRALLSHASGLNREGVGAYWNTLEFPPEADLESVANPAGMLFTPLTRYQYSNIGMSLLGRVVAEVSGETYSAYVQRRILDPLELATVSTDLPLDGDGGRFATGYTDHDARGARRPVTPYRLNGLAPAAGFAASVLDLAKFASWQFRLLETGDEEVLQRVTLRNMHRVHWMDPADPESAIFGLGFGHEKFKDVAMIGHGGYCLGHRAHFAMQPGKKLAVVAMVNANDIDPRLVAAAIFGLTADAIAASTTATAPVDAEVLARVRKLQELEGRFGWPGLPEGFYVIPAADGRLQVIDLYANDPAGSARPYEHVEGDTFRRRRKDTALGETLVFERDGRGTVMSLLTDGYRYFRQ